MATQSSETIMVVLSADERYVLPLSVTAYSLVKNFNKSHQLDLLILDGGITDTSKQYFKHFLPSERVNLDWIQPSSPTLEAILDRSKGKCSFPPAAFYRLILPQLLPQHVQKLIYLDCDILVLGDVSRLWSFDVNGYDFLAVQEPDDPFVMTAFEKWNLHLQGLDLKSFGVTPEHQYFNSGVMLINLEKWRQEGLMERALDFLNDYIPRWPDQDVLNVISAGQWGKLPPQWNQTSAFHPVFFDGKDSPYSPAVMEQVRKNPSIIHFTGSSKPWVIKTYHPQQPLYFEYLGEVARLSHNLRWQLLNRCYQLVKGLKQPIRRFLGKPVEHEAYYNCRDRNNGSRRVLPQREEPS